jgi:GTPase SAR1 family protein
MYTKGNFNDAYKKTQGIDVTNKKITLLSEKDENKPYQQYSQIQLRLFDCGGEEGMDNINIKFVSGMKALIILFDITNSNSFLKVKEYIETSKNYFSKCKDEIINLEDKLITQPESFNDIPILIIGNKSDLVGQRKVNKEQVEDFILFLNKDENYSFINYYEISVKENSGIDIIFQDIIYNYFKRKIYSTAPGNLNIVPDDKNQNKIVDEAEGKEKEENEKVKKPSLDKGMLVYHQMIDKMKKKVILEINNLKEENKKEINKNKKLEEKLDLITNDFNNEKNVLKEKLNLFENKTNELEKELKNKNKEIEDLKQQLNELILSGKDITLKFKINNENVKDEISINTKGETKIIDVIGMLYELCPYINKMDIKGFCLEGKNEKIDEMKTVKENKLVNGSVIVLIV